MAGAVASGGQPPKPPEVFLIQRRGGWSRFGAGALTLMRCDGGATVKGLVILVLVLALVVGVLAWPVSHEMVRGWVSPARDINEIRARVGPVLEADLAAAGLRYGAPVYLRVFKEERVLEVWVEGAQGYALFEAHPICNFSGDLGPKLAEGDHQSPEGFYEVGLEALNPNSRFHLSFNLGFPNSFDRAEGRTGSYLMVHGDCRSVGCYAMTDPVIERIYLLVEAALLAGQGAVPVHAFPFAMSDARMAKARGHRWFAFWEDLAPGYRVFEETREVPEVAVVNGGYRVRAVR